MLMPLYPIAAPMPHAIFFHHGFAIYGMADMSRPGEIHVFDEVIPKSHVGRPVFNGAITLCRIGQNSCAE
jgi:hypothetical protein